MLILTLCEREKEKEIFWKYVKRFNLQGRDREETFELRVFETTEAEVNAPVNALGLSAAHCAGDCELTALTVLILTTLTVLSLSGSRQTFAERTHC